MYVSFQKITLLQNSRGLKRKNQQQQKQTNKQIINNKNTNKSFLWICLIKQSILLNMRLDDIFSVFFPLENAVWMAILTRELDILLRLPTLLWTPTETLIMV